MAYLALVRHGESAWNAQGIWTGITNVELDEEGKENSRKVGEVLKGMDFTVAFTSKLRRAEETLTEILKVLGKTDLPIIEDAALNERDYGSLTGKNKWEVEKEYGEEQFESWRRGWDEPVPGGETLKDVYGRVVPFYKNQILLELLAGKNVLVVAHGNSLRALIKYLDDISDEGVTHLEVHPDEIFIYEIDKNGKIIKKEIKKVDLMESSKY
ncbi:MAG: 2,3-diphosphoglycerate-dependent phosphoglycerate mutase [bacterium]|nr:2,3-diphosphoglycerate-dependent phosphoglycerate mutase [bacterium]